MISDWDAERIAASFRRELQDDRLVAALMAAHAAESVPGPRASAGGSTIAARCERLRAEYDQFCERTDQRERLRAWLDGF